MKLVETLKKTYLVESADEGDTSTQLKGALPIDSSDDPNDIAREYVRSTILGKVTAVKIKNSSIESIQEADEVGPLVELMVKYLPLAEKNAKATAIIKELDKLVNKTTDNDSDYDD